jgi:hypothetical protein
MVKLLGRRQEVAVALMCPSHDDAHNGKARDGELIIAISLYGSTK